MLKKILFIILFLLTSFGYSKEIILKSKKVICMTENRTLCDSLILKVETTTKDCIISFNGKVVNFKRNKVENVIDSEKQIYQSSWIDKGVTYVIINMNDDGIIINYTIYFSDQKLLVEFF